MTPHGRGARANRNRRLKRDRRDVNRSVASHFPRFTQRRLVVEDSFNLVYGIWAHDCAPVSRRRIIAFDAGNWETTTTARQSATARAPR